MPEPNSQRPKFEKKTSPITSSPHFYLIHLVSSFVDELLQRVTICASVITIFLRCVRMQYHANAIFVETHQYEIIVANFRNVGYRLILLMFLPILEFTGCRYPISRDSSSKFPTNSVHSATMIFGKRAKLMIGRKERSCCSCASVNHEVAVRIYSTRTRKHASLERRFARWFWSASAAPHLQHSLRSPWFLDGFLLRP